MVPSRKIKENNHSKANKQKQTNKSERSETPKGRAWKISKIIGRLSYFVLKVTVLSASSLFFKVYVETMKAYWFVAFRKNTIQHFFTHRTLKNRSHFFELWITNIFNFVENS